MTKLNFVVCVIDTCKRTDSNGVFCVFNPLTTTDSGNFVEQRRGITGKFREFREPYSFEKTKYILCFTNILINCEIIIRLNCRFQKTWSRLCVIK